MSSRPSVTLVTYWQFPHVGGVSTHVRQLALQLGIDEGDVISFERIHVYGMPGFRGAAQRLERRLRKKLALETISLQGRNLTRSLRTIETDIVHCHDAMATYAAIMARRRYRKAFKIVSTVHGPFSMHMVEEGHDPRSPDVRKVATCERLAWRQSDAVIAVDDGQAAIVKRQGCEPGRIHVIPNAVDIGKIESMARALSISNSGSLAWILVPRRLSPKNGVEVALRAFASLKGRARLLVAGDGQERGRLETLATELGIMDAVLFLGALPHSVLLPLVRASDVVVIPSVPVLGIEEATSLAAIEAMALGKVVVCSFLGGLKLLVRDGENGVLVEPGDADALASAVEKLLADTILAERLGSAAKRTVQERFGISDWTARHLAVYESVAGHRTAD